MEKKEYRDPIELAWHCCNFGNKAFNSHGSTPTDGVIMGAVETSYQLSVDGLCQEGMFVKARRLGLVSVIAHAYVKSTGGWLYRANLAAYYQIIKEIPVWKAHPPIVRPNVFDQLDGETIEFIDYLNRGYFEPYYPYLPFVIPEEEWQKNGPWHWLWVLTQSYGFQDQGSRAINCLLSDPCSKETALREGLPAAIAFSYCGTRLKLEDPRWLNNPWAQYETCRYAALCVVTFVAFPNIDADEILNKLNYPDPHYLSSPEIDKTLEVMRNWLGR